MLEARSGLPSFVLNIPDDYDLMDPVLIELLKTKVIKYVPFILNTLKWRSTSDGHCGFATQ